MTKTRRSLRNPLIGVDVMVPYVKSARGIAPPIRGSWSELGMAPACLPRVHGRLAPDRGWAPVQLPRGGRDESPAAESQRRRRLRARSPQERAGLPHRVPLSRDGREEERLRIQHGLHQQRRQALDASWTTTRVEVTTSTRSRPGPES